MKLKDESLQWIYDHIDDFKRAIVALDFAKSKRMCCDEAMYRRADDLIHNLAFSFLMVAMGENIPKSLWSVDDYAMLYGIIMDDDNDLEVTNDG